MRNVPLCYSRKKRRKKQYQRELKKKRKKGKKQYQRELSMPPESYKKEAEAQTVLKTWKNVSLSMMDTSLAWNVLCRSTLFSITGTRMKMGRLPAV